jgi:polysaccharide export outer membrane protein
MRRWFRRAWSSAGSDALPALLAVLAFAPAWAQLTPERARTSAEIRIALPAGVEPIVALSPRTDRITLELPAGATLPEDFAASSGGLLRSARREPAGEGRIRLELELERGLLDEVVYEPGSLLLRFGSRFRAESALAEADELYLLGPTDRFVLNVHNHPDLKSELTVGQDGWITAPLVGDVRAAGQSPRQLAATIAELLGRCCLVDPQVDIGVLEYRSQWVMVTGEVRGPGRIQLRGGTRLKEILSEAGGFAEESGEEITISRRRDDGAESVVLRVERSEFENGLVNPSVQHGDIIDVPRARYCYIQGEVNQPGRVRVEREMTLLRVIALAGGLTDWANQKDLRVLEGEGPEARERVYNLRDIYRRKVPDPVIRGGEVIIVKKRFL